MKVYALVGKSGTGKSFQAINLCQKMGIESIVDDGLFIYKSKAVAGKSAKREATKIGAVKRAIFTKEDHRIDVSKKIQELRPESILLIGTSDAMVDKIAAKLELGEIHQRVYIEDITSEADRKLAHKYRHQMGQHIIPVSAMQIKRDFSGYLLSPMRLFKSFGESKGIGEKSLVRPTYSYMGNFIISDRVIGDIVRCTAADVDGVVEIIKISTGDNIEELEVTVSLSMKKGYNVIEIGRVFQDKSLKMIEEMTAFNVKSLDVEIRKVV